MRACVAELPGLLLWVTVPGDTGEGFAGTTSQSSLIAVLTRFNGGRLRFCRPVPISTFGPLRIEYSNS